MSIERWFPEDRHLLPPGFTTKVIGRDGKRWLVVKPEKRDGVAGHLTIRVVDGNECSDDALIDHKWRCRHCKQKLQTEHLQGCAYLEDEAAVAS